VSAKHEEIAEGPAKQGRSHTFPIAVLDLVEEVRRMRTCPMPGGHYGRTLLRTDDMRIVLMILEHGTRLTEHQVNGTSTIQALDGQ
jgi:hypothetical protein